MPTLSTVQNNVRHFLTLLDLSPAALHWIINRAIALKGILNSRQLYDPFPNYVLGMIFEKPSTRTRVSFEAGIAQLGGHAIFLSINDSQLGRGETIADSAKVISRMVDIVVIRTDDHSKITEFAAHSQVPVINALTNDYHPCQLLADVQTFIEHRGDITGKTVAWIGDGNNMCQSFINAAHQFDFQLRIACPQGYYPNADLMAFNADRVSISQDPVAAVTGASLVVTDTWSSMGQEEETKQRKRAFTDYQVNKALLDHAGEDVLFMHCLPAYRGLEISHDLFEDPRCVVFDEAENRLHAQKALMEFLLLTPSL